MIQVRFSADFPDHKNLHVVHVTSCQGVSNLSQLVSEMRQAFQKDTPLYAKSAVRAPPPEGRSESPD